ncbi:MAG: hypothetical protein ACRC8D_08540 [Aeromonas sp.]
MAKESPHPSTMERSEIERELLALRVMSQAFTDCIAAGELAVTQEGKDRLQAARAAVLVIYGKA